MVKLLQMWTGIARLSGCGYAYNQAVTTVVLSQVQGTNWEICALLRCISMGDLWIAPPCSNDQRPSMGEVMRSTESRMRENRTSGLTSKRSETTYGSLPMGA